MQCDNRWVALEPAALVLTINLFLPIKLTLTFTVALTVTTKH